MNLNEVTTYQQAIDYISQNQGLTTSELTQMAGQTDAAKLLSDQLFRDSLAGFISQKNVENASMIHIFLK